MTKEELLQLQAAEVPYEERVDISDVKIDLDLLIVQRMEDYIRQIKNPYAFYQRQNSQRRNGILPQRY